MRVGVIMVSFEIRGILGVVLVLVVILLFPLAISPLLLAISTFFC